MVLTYIACFTECEICRNHEEPMIQTHNINSNLAHRLRELRYNGESSSPWLIQFQEEIQQFKELVKRHLTNMARVDYIR